MGQLLGPDGLPITSQAISEHKKAAPPKLGPSYGAWAGEDIRYMTLPGGGAVQLDLSRLTLGDFRQMRDHYQINSSLTLLTFMLHQIEWHIESEDQKVEDFVQGNMELIWTRLVRGMSQAFWAGYSPMVLEWENDTDGRRIVVDKVKDLIPEDCLVHWKTVEGASSKPAKPKLKVYDGINQLGWPEPIPVRNTLWYPLLMENGDYYGKKLMRPAFTSWFFSILLHLFANRYYERFGEPTPIGRAPFEDEIEWDGTRMPGNQAMSIILSQLRNRSVVVLPNDKTPFGDENQADYDYKIDYLESQMRGADFERYMTRLDEEMSLALFTPILMLRTADVGSYNLGVGHQQAYLWMLNAIDGDWKPYIDRYLLSPLVDFNFGEKAKRARIKFVKLGKVNGEILRTVIGQILSGGGAEVDLREVGEQAGLTLTEIEQLTEEPKSADPPGRGEDRLEPRGTDEPRATAEDITARIAGQVEGAFRKGTFGPGLKLNMGFRRRFEESLRAEGYTNAYSLASDFYRRMDNWLQDVVALGPDEFGTSDKFVSLFRRTILNEVERLAK